MKRIIALIVTVSIASGYQLSEAAKPVYKAFAPPDAGKSAMLKSGVKTYKYYEIESGKPVSITVKGPTRIKIRTRALLTGNIDAGDYRMTVWEGDRVRAGRKASTKPSKLTVAESQGQVGMARDLIFKVPEGTHSYTISFQSDRISKYYLRFYQEKTKKKKSAYQNYRPYEFARREKLHSGKSVISYYFVNDKGGAKLKVIGPTKLKIFCRANFDPTVKDKSKFTLGIFENGKNVKKFSGVAKKSTKSIFANVTDLIPSTVHTFVLDVAGGEHEYEFRKVNSSSPNLAVRFKILKSSLGKSR